MIKAEVASKKNVEEAVNKTKIPKKANRDKVGMRKKSRKSIVTHINIKTTYICHWKFKFNQLEEVKDQLK